MQRQGFTLIETLVVVGIIAVACAILMPALKQARARAVQVQVISNLRTISIAIVTYKNDFKGSLPWVNRYAVPGYTDPKWAKGYDGAIILCHALIGPADFDDMDGDAVPQMGFRTRPGGRIYGPYLPSDGFTIQDLDKPRSSQSPAAGPKGMSAPVICDSFGNPILYFPASPVRANVRLAPTGPAAAPPYVGSSEASRYDLSDNLAPNPKAEGPFGRPTDASAAEAAQRVQVMLGDNNMNGVVDADEQEVNEPYLLWSAGADGVFGPNAPTPDAAARCDDATTFR